MPKILVIEDETAVREELALLLTNEGYQVTACAQLTMEKAQEQLKNVQLILLDVGLPELDGFALCQKIRKETDTPIIFVTSRSTSMDELMGLSLGADDYVTKPYNIPVLLARIKNVLNRNQDSGEVKETLEAKGLVVFLAKGYMTYAGQKAELTRNELKILHCLMTQSGRIVSRMALIDYLWDNEIYIDDNTLSVNMTRLRGKLKNLGLGDFITTKRGMGYKI